MKGLLYHRLLMAFPLFAAVHAAAAEPPGKAYVYEGREYSTPLEACEAVAKARREDRSVDNPYGRVAEARDADDKFFCKLADSNDVTQEQTYGSTTTRKASKSAQSDMPQSEGPDPCLDPPVKVTREPNYGRCPHSWRAWNIKLELHNSDPKKWPPPALNQKAIAVSSGVLAGGKSVTLITTDDLSFHRALSKSKGWRRQSGEEMGREPKPGEHAEDAAQRTFEELGLLRGRRVNMGTDPKACPKCTANYRRHPWIAHERLRR